MHFPIMLRKFNDALGRDAEPEPEPPEPTHFGRSRSRSRRNGLLGVGAVKKRGDSGSEQG